MGDGILYEATRPGLVLAEVFVHGEAGATKTSHPPCRLAGLVASAHRQQPGLGPGKGRYEGGFADGLARLAKRDR